MAFNDLFRATGISRSGLNAERLRMEVTANNIANAFSTRGADGGPFRRQDVVFAAVLQDQAGQPTLGGVEAEDVVDDPTPFPVVYIPGHPDADGQGNVRMPNVEIPIEMVNLVTASRAYEANVRAAESFAGSFAARRWLPPASPTEPAQGHDETKPPGPPPASLSQRLIDELIEEGRFAQALDTCRASAAPGDPLAPAVTYRLALCLEGLGRPAEAAAAYRECVSRGTSEHLHAAARLGLARVALRQDHPDEGQELLCAILSRSARPALRDRPYAAGALVLLALSLAEEFQPGETPSATRPAALARAAPAPGVEAYVGWDAPPRQGAARATSWTPTGALHITRPPSAAAQALVEASLPIGPLVEGVERLAEASRLEVDWGPGAKDALLGREGELVCAGTPMADVLVWLTLPFGLTAQVEAKAVKIRLAAKLPAPERQRLRGDLAMASLRAALLAGANHPHSGHVYLAMGNLEAVAGHVTEARGWYERLLRDRPRSPALVEGMYNLGLLRLREGDLVRARQAFFQAIDRAPGHEMTSLCHWWIARTHLDEADAAGGRRALLRCVQAGSGTPARPARGKSDTLAAAGLALACAHLFDGQPRQAWEALHGVRAAVQEPPFLEPATLLDGIARYQLAGDDSKKREAVLAGLVGVVLSPRSSLWLGPMLPYLRGQALRRLGLRQEMVTLYEQQLRATDGALAVRMEFEVADALQSSGQDARARDRLERLLAAAGKAGNRELAATATLRLATLDLRANQPDACLNRCRALLSDRSADRTAVLALMGRAYTSKKDYARAASCLAGEVPAP
jgi:flagellar basal-body rod protein FlgC